MISKYEQLTVVEYDEARNDQVQGGYKYLIKNNVYSYEAYRTDKGFNDWLKRCNITLVHIETKTMERDGKTSSVKIYKASGTIVAHLFWSLDEVPEKATKFKGLSNGSLVDCYYIHTKDGAEIYRPNPNAKEIYKPLPLEEHIEFMSVNG